jgi:hypothetical protein
LSPQTQKLATVLNPLGRTEAKRAIATAVEHLRPELTRDGQSRFRALGAQLYVTRPMAKGKPTRLVEVRVVDYLNWRHLRVVIAGSRVVEVRPLDWQPAFSAEEIAEAEAIVARCLLEPLLPWGERAPESGGSGCAIWSVGRPSPPCWPKSRWTWSSSA